MKQEIKDYLNKQGIKTEQALAEHIVELKRNTVVPEVMFELVGVLVHEKDCLLNFFAENKKVKTSYVDLSRIREYDDKYKKIDKETKPSEEILKLIGYQWVNDSEEISYWGGKKCINIDEDENQIHQEKVKTVLDDMLGKKESQTVQKAPIFTYCKVNKNAIEALSLRALHGHIKYEKGDDWENFTRVPNADFEYSNSQFRHSLDIGEEDEETHLIASAWNAVARLELYLRNKVK